MVLISGKDNNKIPLVVDTSLYEWSSLHPNNINNIIIDYGLLNECKEYYPGGVLPGMIKKDDKTQKATIKRFDNFLQWTKLLEEDVFNSEGKMYLRSKFFERRERAWKCPFFLRREGKVVGYYIDSVFLHRDDSGLMEQYIFLYAYKDMIYKLPAYQKILNHLKAGGSIDLQCENITYALTPTFSLDKILEQILLEDVSSQK